MCSNLRTIDNGGQCSIVCLPGWATDWRIFRDMHTECNVVSPESFLPASYMNDLTDYLREERTDPITVCGWSLGAYAGLTLAQRVPHKIRRMILIGVRSRYPETDIKSVKQSLLDEPERCLRRFYRQCFLPAQRDDYRTFRTKLMDAYLDAPDVESLCAGLDVLAEYHLPPDTLPECDIIMVHGQNDVVAPVTEARKVADAIPSWSLHEFEECGHAAFMKPEFRDLFTNE